MIYTGDTATLEPFTPLLQNGTYLYAEAATFHSGVHLYIDDILPKLEQLTHNGISVFLMHLDDENTVIKKIDGTLIRLAQLYEK